jgi:hypothetical protein
MSKQRGVAIYDRWSDEASPTRPAKRWYVRGIRPAGSLSLDQFR